MAFTERVQAFILAKFYVRLTEYFGTQGEQAFVLATHYYAEQRGRRMAQRAIRDGKPLTYATYCEYGEWVNSQEMIDEGSANAREIRSWSPDLEIRTSICPWYVQFKEMGLSDAGHLYCTHIDVALCRGFNPYIQYEAPHSLHRSPHCTHIIRDANFEVGHNPPKNPAGLRSFEYHCAHAFHSFSQIIDSIFASSGMEVTAAVLQDFKDTYGLEMADTLMSYRHTNFNVI